MRGLYWVRSDLRVHDNVTLQEFCRECSEGVFLWTPTRSYGRSESYRRKFLDEAVRGFQSSLGQYQQGLLRGTRDVKTEIIEALREYKIEKVYFTQEYACEERQDEDVVLEVCREMNIPVSSFDQGTLVREDDLPFSLAEMPFIFTDFRKKVEASLKVASPVAEPISWPRNLIQHNAEVPLGVSGEEKALKRLRFYFWDVRAVISYKETRNGLLGENDSTRFSPWFSVGALSPRKVYSELKDFEKAYGANESTYWLFFELLWRDYFKFFSRKYVAGIFLEKGLRDGGPEPVVHDEPSFQKWCEGKTSDPFVNANMIELRQTGWMSNRGRQNVASFLIHDLHLPWTWGAAYFERRLLDYDPDLNWGNWLYLSGRGSDPRARKFNTEKQAAQYDPQGLFQKRWLGLSGEHEWESQKS